MDKKRSGNFLFDKLFFPKVVLIDKPGICISKVSAWYSRKESKKRIIWYFEDILSDLQIHTVKRIGKEKTSKLWYRIGKDAGMRYMLFGKSKPPLFLLPSIINYICNSLRSAGLGVAENVSYDHNFKSLVLEGKDCVICRKSNIPDNHLGFLSAVISHLLGTNVEAKYEGDNCPNKCKIVINKSIPKKYINKKNELKALDNYDRLNFSYNTTISEKLSSFTDFLRFKKIEVNKFNKIAILGEVILPYEIGALELICEKYKEIKQDKLFRSSVVKSSKNLVENILNYQETVKERINKIINILVTLGWGIPLYFKERNSVGIKFLCPPISKYPPVLRGMTINGFLNSVFMKNLFLEKIVVDKKPPVITFKYKL